MTDLPPQAVPWGPNDKRPWPPDPRRGHVHHRTDGFPEHRPGMDVGEYPFYRAMREFLREHAGDLGWLT